MKNLIGAMTLMFCLTAGISDATVESFDPETGIGTIGPSGCVSFCVTVSSDGETYTVDPSGCVDH